MTKMDNLPLLLLLLVVVINLAVAFDPNFKHAIEHDVGDEVRLLDARAPVSFSPRVRRQIASGALTYVYDTDTDDSTGNWGPWEKGPQPCSRSCGGGVSVETRSCSGADCTGPTKRYSSCNTGACPAGGVGDVRLEQCSKFNGVPFERKLYEWVPYLKAPRKCELNCMPRGERFYYRHAKTVIDGTPCDLNDGLRRVCVEGECVAVGCDGMLGSDVREDNCRVCGGNGANCNTVAGELLNQDLVMGYNDLLLIPAGATNVRISEMKASNNYLGLRNTEGTYFINGNWRIDFPNDYEVAGTIAHYERKAKGSSGKKGRLLTMFAPEQIRMLGPTREPLYLVMLYQEENPGVEFEYSMPSGALQETPKEGEGYAWTSGPWSDCEAKCGEGHKTRSVFCALNMEAVADNLCDGSEKPAETEACTAQPCQPAWRTGEWSNCSASISADEADFDGSGGGAEAAEVGGECPAMMLRNVFCEQIVGSGLATIVEDHLCNQAEKPRPQKACSEDDAAAASDQEPKFHAGPWGGCSALCGQGVRKRAVTCYVDNGTLASLPEESCQSLEKPSEEEPCEATTPCTTHDWIATEWSGCIQSSACASLALESRHAVCADPEGNVATDDSLCDANRKPALTRDCQPGEQQELPEDCEFAWMASEWSECSSKCKSIEGVQSRRVFCSSESANNNGSIAIEEDESRCNAELKYPTSQRCFGADDCTGSWFATPWSECSNPCGGGTQTRKVLCISEGLVVAPENCQADQMPAADGDCNVQDCEEASGEDEGEGKCEAYYDDFWIFGEEASGEGQTEDEASEDESSGSGEGSGEKALTKEELQVLFGDKRCKPVPPEPCANTTFGCCQDGHHAASGPFQEGCPQFLTCADTRFGCCLDGATVANGSRFAGCPPSKCAESLFGCCSDGETAAGGPNGEGCEENKMCESGPFGCCPDQKTFAQGPKKQGCFECPEEVWMCDSCDKTEFGCCIDLENAARGPNFEGCPIDGVAAFVDCATTEHGCCPDGSTRARGPNFKGCERATPCKDSLWGCCDDLVHPAHGPEKQGCCLTTRFGCCPDNTRPADGLNLEGCSCEDSEFGCCPDDESKASGPGFGGCGCFSSEFGCCPDKVAYAQGPGYAGCPCHTHEYGCCADGKAIARGPGQEGCSCKDTEFGCCPDRSTPAGGINGLGCGCAASKHGCCPDGVTNAEDENFLGCDSDVPIPPPDVCGLQKDRGEEKNYTAKWFFDTEYGGCSRFWYGGSGGNRNNFDDRQSCQEVCVEPVGRDACELPLVSGPCEGYYPRWGYVAAKKSCEQFIYGGCLGNNNKYESKEECEAVCSEETEISDLLVDKCEQPIKAGPCAGNFSRWGYSRESGQCEPFVYGGCKGNANSFMSLDECQNSCSTKATARDMCLLPRSKGPCKDMLPKWYFDNYEKRCLPFYFGGCEGNANRFDSKEACQKTCPSEFLQNDVCQQPQLPGPCRDYLERYYFDPSDGTCKMFYYGGCEGNKNNFKSMESCRSRCSVDYSIPIEEEFKLEFCFLAKDEGVKSDGGKVQKRWYYDSTDGTCKQFDYLGKKGNGNRFLNRQDCQTSCQPSQDVCTLPKVVGPCEDRIEQFWYDKNKDACFTFDYGGCHGNGNRFESMEFCTAACKRSGPGMASFRGKKRPGPQGALVNICNLPRDLGSGSDKSPSWFYDSAKSECTAFLFSGQGGNANRFTTQEQCDRECGIFRDQDVCNMEKDIGPCVGRFQKWFYDKKKGECKEFTFGGCEGNGNRFSSKSECESVCLLLEEPELSGLDTEASKVAICRLPVDVGPCDDKVKRYHFSSKRGTCVPFVYGGCAGNRNRFKSFDVCLGFCNAARSSDSSDNEAAPDNGEVSLVTEPPLGPRPDLVEAVKNELFPNEYEDYDEERCKASKERCNEVKCQYGILRYKDDRSKCTECYCNEPCYGYKCPDKTKCSVDIEQNKQGQLIYRAVCREEKKSGVCPKLSRTNVANSKCLDECSIDSDCFGDHKCCFDGCAYSCLPSVVDPGYIDGGDASPTDVPAIDPNAANVRAFKPTVVIGEGNIAVLSVIVTGNPKPDVYWRKGRTDIDVRRGKYKIIDGGSLQIVGVDLSDEGEYTCFADNGRGIPAYVTITVAIDSPTEIPARIVQPTNSDLVMSLGSPAHFSCLAFGYPKPTVTWWKDTVMLPLTDGNIEQTSGYGLLVRQVGLTNLGAYTCQAYNGLGPADSATYVLRALGPIDRSSLSQNERKFLSYVVDAPSYYYPSQPENEPDDGDDVILQVTPVVETTTKKTSGYISARIDVSRSRFPLNDRIVLPCTVNSYAKPTVQWYFNGQPLRYSQRIQMLRENNTLVIVDSRSSDTGSYSCVADNGYNTDSSTVAITVENVTLRQECTDNPYFANCKLIVKAEYCTNKYYAKFCCKSCTLAGQLRSA